MGQTDTTDDRGSYRIGLLEPGEYLVCVPMSQALAANATLEDMATIAGGGYASALLTALSAGGPGVSFNYSSADGGATFNVTTAGAALTTAPTTQGQAYATVFYPFAPTASRATLVKVTSGAEQSGLDFQLRPVPVSRISGTVTGPNGPAANLAVTLRPSQAGDLIAPMETATARTDGAGNFRFNSVPQGDYIVRVASAGAPLNGPGPVRIVTSANGIVAVDEIAVAPGAAGRGGPPPPPPPPPPMVD